MPIRLSKSEIEEMLFSKFLYEMRMSDRWNARTQEIMGEVETESEMISGEALRINVHRAIASAVAGKLITNDRRVPLIDIEDLDLVIHNYVLNKIADDPNGAEMDPWPIERMIKLSMKNLVANLAGSGDPYEVYGRFIATILAVTEELGIAPDEPLSDEMYDEVTRRVFTREQYIERRRDLMMLIEDPRLMIDDMLRPILDLMAGDDIEMRDQMEKMAREKLENDFNGKFRKLADLFEEILQADVARIYHN